MQHANALISSCLRYSAAAPGPVKRQDPLAEYLIRPAPSANSQALMDAAAARDAELRARVAQADLTQHHGARIEELKAMVDGFISADRQFLQLPGGIRHCQGHPLTSCHAVCQVWRHGNEGLCTSMQALSSFITPPPRFSLLNLHFSACASFGLCFHFVQMYFP
jgi:hypothetical protein